MPVDEGLALHDAAVAAARSLPGMPMLEVGTYCGKSAVYLGAACLEVDPPTVVFTVDHHRGSEENQAGWEHHDTTLIDPTTGRLNTLPTFLRTMREADLEGTVIGVVGLSPIVAAHWETPLAFLFIDGGHGVEPRTVGLRVVDTEGRRRRDARDPRRLPRPGRRRSSSRTSRSTSPRSSRASSRRRARPAASASSAACRRGWRRNAPPCARSTDRRATASRSRSK